MNRKPVKTLERQIAGLNRALVRVEKLTAEAAYCNADGCRPGYGAPVGGRP